MEISPEGLAGLLEKHGMSKAELAQELHVSEHTVRAWLLGRNRCGGASARAIELLFECRDLRVAMTEYSEVVTQMEQLKARIIGFKRED
jgi:orotate phosphoribosyltransferase-like protein